MVRVRVMRRASVPKSLLPLPSPAFSHSHRVATVVTENGKYCKVLLGSGARLYHLKVELQEHTIVEGKEKLLIPEDAQVFDASWLDHCPHQAEIQSVAVSVSRNDGEVLVGSVDSYGRLVVCLDDVDNGAPLYTAHPRDGGIGEGGWAGLAFSLDQPSLVVVARGLAKSVDLYDGDINVRTLRTLQHPSALTFLSGPYFGSSSSSTIAVAEGSQISIWDLRASEKGGFVQRILGAYSGGSLYAVCSSPTGLLATGGAERTVLVFDPLKWSALSRWTACTKYEISGLAFSSLDPDLIYVHGLDYEVICGRWIQSSEGGMGRCFGFRGDSRWLGVDKCVGSDVLAGWSESGSLFVSEVVAS
ncbi:unnamed protein product [Calypogeia fissa]